MPNNFMDILTIGLQNHFATKAREAQMAQENDQFNANLGLRRDEMARAQSNADRVFNAEQAQQEISNQLRLGELKARGLLRDVSPADSMFGPLAGGYKPAGTVPNQPAIRVGNNTVRFSSPEQIASQEESIKLKNLFAENEAKTILANEERNRKLQDLNDATWIPDRLKPKFAASIILGLPYDQNMSDLEAWSWAQTPEDQEDIVNFIKQREEIKARNSLSGTVAMLNYQDRQRLNALLGGFVLDPAAPNNSVDMAAAIQKRIVELQSKPGYANDPKAQQAVGELMRFQSTQLPKTAPKSNFILDELKKMQEDGTISPNLFGR